jgi:SAM-dependent methyltransferase
MTMTIANVEMAKAWDGEEGDDWTDHADRYDAAATAIWQRFLDADLIRPPDRVLDIGCGTGHSTRDVARLAAEGSVLGVDLSSRMLALARQRSAEAGITNTEFIQADAQVHPFEPESFDMVISVFGAMFFADRDAAFANIGSAVRPGGRIALQAWRGLDENAWLVGFREALAAGRELGTPPMGGPGPFGLADVEGVERMLNAVGFGDVVFTAVDAPMYLGADAEDAWEFVSTMGVFRGLTHGLDDATRDEAVAKLRKLLADNATPDGVQLPSGSWLITASR